MELYDEKIENEISTSKIPVLVEFYARWCRPCHVMIPIVQKLEVELKDKAKIFILDIEANPKLADKFTVLTLPTFVIYKDGKKVKTLTGIREKEELLSALGAIPAVL